MGRGLPSRFPVKTYFNTGSYPEHELVKPARQTCMNSLAVVSGRQPKHGRSEHSVFRLGLFVPASEPAAMPSKERATTFLLPSTLVISATIPLTILKLARGSWDKTLLQTQATS